MHHRLGIMAIRRTNTAQSQILAERIESRIFLIRGQKVMLSLDLAALYGVPVKRLNEAVKRNLERFPSDLMFQLSKHEYDILKSQIATSSWGGARRALPYAFTEEGVAMLSAVLRSQTAVAVSIQIMRVFVRLRRLLSTHEPFRRKLAALEKKLAEHDHQFAVVFEAIRQLMEEPEPPRKPRIGFETEAGG
jgi:ORF6N domain